MAEKTKKVLLSKALTWAGENYAPGVNALPEAAANYAVKRDFGKIIEEDTAGGGSQPAGSETGEFPDDFPMAQVLHGLGLKYEEVSKMNRDDLIALKGIGEKSADAILAYGK